MEQGWTARKKRWGNRLAARAAEVDDSRAEPLHMCGGDVFFSRNDGVDLHFVEIAN